MRILLPAMLRRPTMLSLLTEASNPTAARRWPRALYVIGCFDSMEEMIENYDNQLESRSLRYR